MNRELFGLTVQRLIRRRRSNLLLFMVLLLSFAFAITPLTVTESIRKTNEKFLFDTYGEWYGVIPDATEEIEAFLRGEDWLDKLGISTNYGSVGGTGIGTVDEGFLRVGRITLHDGHFPKNSGEIAMEEDLLSALGYDYRLGQEITFVVTISAGPFDFVEVEQTYTLCGVIGEYTDIWRTPPTCRPLNGAIITSADAVALRQSAQDLTASSISAVKSQHYFSVRPGMEEEAEKQLKYFLSTVGGSVTHNSAVSSTVAEYDATYTFYAAVILAVTMLSVVCIYFIQLQDEARQLATFRSIGITKRQLCLMLLYETVCLAIPAAVLGIGASALATLALLRLAMYSGSVNILVTVPPLLLGGAVPVWLAAVLIARLAIFLAALRTPLTGRFHTPRARAKRYRRLQRALITALSGLMCAAIVFTAVESLESAYFLEDRYTFADYHFFPRKNDPISAEDLAAIAQIPGVTDVRPYGHTEGILCFDGIEDSALAQEHARWLDESGYLSGELLESADEEQDWQDKEPVEALTVEILMIDDSDWESNTIDFRSSGVDMEKFRAGEAVLLSFDTDNTGAILSADSRKEYAESDIGISAGDTVRISIGSTEVEAEAAIHHFVLGKGMHNRFLPLMGPYTVICSETFMDKLSGNLGVGNSLPYGYSDVLVYADLTAGYATDKMVAELCVSRFILDNSRERYTSEMQGYLQTLVLLFSGGGCVAVVSLLILISTLALESERQRRSYSILQAIGLSRRQLGRREFRTALGRGALAALLGWLAYGGYRVFYTVRQYRFVLTTYGRTMDLEEFYYVLIGGIIKTCGLDLKMALLLIMLVIALVMLASWLAKRRLMRDDLMEKLRDEH